MKKGNASKAVEIEEQIEKLETYLERWKNAKGFDKRNYGYLLDKDGVQGQVSMAHVPDETFLVVKIMTIESISKKIETLEAELETL